MVERFDLEQIANQYEELFRRVATENSRKRASSKAR